MASAQPNPSFWEEKKVTVTGGAGFLGKAAVRQLEELGAYVRVIRSSEHDLRDAEQTADAVEGAEVVLHLAARVGGIGFNRRNPGPLAYDNTVMGTHIFEQSRLAGVEKLVAACSVCAYPKHTPVPFSEDSLWDGYPEESNAPYGIAKQMLIELSDAYRRQYGFDSCATIMANLYGPDDNFDLEDSHVIAAMIRKFVEARDRGDDRVTLWGTGSPSREFLYVDDAARGLILAAERLPSPPPGDNRTRGQTRAPPPARAARLGAAGEHRHRRRDADPRPGRDDPQAERLRGRDRVGHVDAGRPADALPRRVAGARAVRLRGGDAARGGAAADHRELPRAAGPRGRVLNAG